MRSSLLIYNPAAGQWWRRPRPERIQRALARHGYQTELLVTRCQDHATELVRDHLSADVEVVWVCGGDGTLGQAATALVDTGVPIGILPAGTVNVVASECGIPNNPYLAVATLAHTSERRHFQTWVVGGRAVVLGIGVGFDARIMGDVDLQLKDWFGFLAVGSQGVAEWARYEFPGLQVVGEDETGRPFELESTQVLVSGPKRFAGRKIVLPAADPEDNLLDLVLFHGNSRLRLAAFWLGLELPGTAHLRLPGVRTLRARHLRVTAAEGGAVEVHVNGDVVDTTPVDVQPWGRVEILAPAR